MGSSLARRAHDSLVGEVLAGRYRVVRMLGKGGMGAVYEAVQEDLGRRVAVKVLHPFLSEDSEHISRFKREARSAAGLGHPNVIQVTDFHSAPGELAFLVMEYLEGVSLRDIMKQEGKLEPARLVPVILQVLSALASAHGAGIIHRDLKPGNIFLVHVDGIGEIAKLLDFGIAKMTDGTGYTMLTRTGVTLGTPVYMAPEQVTGRQVDTRTDIYAVGVITYRALAGRAPFKSTDVGDLLRQILIEPAPPLTRYRPDLEEALVEIVERATSKLPNERYQSAAAMAEALAPWASGAVRLTAPPPRPPEEVLPPSQGASEPIEDSRIETIVSKPTPTSNPAQQAPPIAEEAPDEESPAADMATSPDLVAPMEVQEAAIAAAIEAQRRRDASKPSPRSREHTSGPSAPAVGALEDLPKAAPPPSRTTKLVIGGVALLLVVCIAALAALLITRVRRGPEGPEVRASIEPGLVGAGTADAGAVGPTVPVPVPTAEAGVEAGVDGGAPGRSDGGDPSDAAADPTALSDADPGPPRRRTPLRCRAGDEITLENVVIDHPRGTAVQARQGCQLTLRNCTLRGRRFGLQVLQGSRVSLENCTIWGRRFGMHVTGRSEVRMIGGEVAGRLGSVDTSGRSEIHLDGTRLRGRVRRGSSRIHRSD